MSDRPQRIWAWETNEVTQVSPPTVRIRNIWGSPYSAPDDATEYIRADLALPAVQPVTGEPVTLTYTNWRRETAQRTIVPQRVWFGSTDWHPEPQWLLTALDTEKGADRDFALKDFGKPAVQPDAAALMDALKDAHDALVSARAFILQKYGSTNPARENAIRKARALLPTEGQQP